jgi:signal transduction histidine kinase
MSSSESSDLLVIRSLGVSVQNKVILNNLDLRLARGEIHALFGDENEQKVALLKALSGELPRSAGSFIFDGRGIQKHSPRRAMKLGIETIDKSRKGFLNLSVLENVFSERSIRGRMRLVDGRSMRRSAADFFDTISVDIDLDDPLSSLSPVNQRLVEIGRSICAHPKLLLIDESLIDEIKPTLRPQTIERLYYVFSVLARGGTTILYNSNSMDQVFKFANRVSIVRNGSILKTTPLAEIDKMQLVQLTYSSILSRRELEKSNFELFYTKQIYEGIINSLALPIMVTDTRRNVIVLNEAAEKLLRTRAEAVFCKPVHEVLGLSEETIAGIEEEIRSKSKTEFRYATGIHPEADLFVFPIMDEVESIMGMLLVFSRRGDAIDFEREIRANAERYNSEYRIAKIIHEVKNPLGIMLNHLRLIRTEQSIDRLKENARSIEKEVERVGRLLEKLKRKEEPAKRLRDSTRTSGIVREIAELLDPLIRKNRIRMRIESESDSTMPHDPDLIRQMLLNIVLNGIEAMGEGGELVIASRTGWIGAKGMIVIEISDNGKGIEKEDLERIFQPFYTTKQDGGSSGMGLSISREIVHSLDGLITVESTPGEGSRFRVLLPMNGREEKPMQACH